MIGTALRRSVGRTAAPVMLAVVAAHVFLRGRTWTHEWMWAVYQFGFVVILLGPLVAGVAAWEGWRLSTAGDLLATSLRSRWAMVQAWLATLAWGLLVYAAGFVTVVLLVLAGGPPGWPDLHVLGAMLPPVFLLAAEAAVGMLVGWWLRHALAAPAAALACFGVSLWCYAAGPSQFITVGGATSSLVGLAPRPGVELAQVLCFAAVALVAVLLAARPRPYSPVPSARSERVPAAVSGVVLVAAVGLLSSQSDNVLEHVGAQLSCTGRAPSVCVAAGYRSEAAGARAALLPYVERLRAAGAPVPVSFAQDVQPGRVTAGPVDASFLLGDRSEAPFLVLNSYLDKDCFASAPSSLQDEWSAMITWLDPRIAKGSGGDGGLPVVARGPSTPAQRAWVRRVIADLSACGR